jgi:hypothetical protein
MTKFVVDCGVVLQLASEGFEVPAEHELLAPTLLRSQTLSALHEAVHPGEISPDVALDRLTRIRAIPIRLLGDAPSQSSRRAFLGRGTVRRSALSASSQSGSFMRAATRQRTAKSR